MTFNYVLLLQQAWTISLLGTKNRERPGTNMNFPGALTPPLKYSEIGCKAMNTCGLCTKTFPCAVFHVQFLTGRDVPWFSTPEFPCEDAETLGGLSPLSSVTQLVSSKVENLTRSSESIPFPQTQGKGERLWLKTIRCRLTSMREGKACGPYDRWTFPAQKSRQQI